MPRRSAIPRGCGLSVPAIVALALLFPSEDTEDANTAGVERDEAMGETLAVFGDPTKLCAVLLVGQ